MEGGKNAAEGDGGWSICCLRNVKTLDFHPVSEPTVALVAVVGDYLQKAPTSEQALAVVVVDDALNAVAVADVVVVVGVVASDGDDGASSGAETVVGAGVEDETHDGD